MASSECRNAIDSRSNKKKTVTIVSIDDVTKSHFSCFFSKDNKIIVAFYELDTLTWNKGLILALIH